MFEDISLISYPNQNVGLYINPFSSLIGILSILAFLLAFANRMPRRTFVVGKAPAHVLDDRLLCVRESVMVLAMPLVHEAVHIGLLLVVFHPLQEEAATHGERMVKDLEHNVGIIPVCRETQGLVAIP